MPVKHIVLFKFKADAGDDKISAVKDGLLALKPSLPGILDMSFGATFMHDRAQGYTHALVVDLKDKDALTEYAGNADHVAVITNHIKPNLDAPPLAMDYEF
uniref:Stress-response A/B barrel domain-containing protein n=1 Tax=Hemiselmis andersenii TaxID=464988 RepID=A0A6U5BI28_HEMAN|mmetsp:Transcript_6581/g.15187  ORF Transcript_6581/g.15187 Transcript_6581/m.15187 type:complete len:101 (+) Transcript_6581:104-406(+)|eukprot:CAMPEP_0114138648 /NCGR_PEP_ID=MMETSP0043_2-20121206/16434_1 /TAXON_ID=464988 /ORGANISM="Hemiselmis andersenii, Strain CCMP644" /LENGTH=100 /DNA_ID=CAMNT_0001232631 /DNA_START=76 /DNA_END=378 /DNA_ORIENTATION=-